MPANVIAKSNAIAIQVTSRFVGTANLTTEGTRVLIEWEPWFTQDNIGDWTTAEGIPIVGK